MALQKWSGHFVQMLAATLVGVTFLLAVGFLAAFHWSLVARNDTTIESYKRVTLLVALIKQGQNPFHLGVWGNMRSLFGPSPWLWPLPIKTTVGDGYGFSLNERSIIV